MLEGIFRYDIYEGLLEKKLERRELGCREAGRTLIKRLKEKGYKFFVSSCFHRVDVPLSILVVDKDGKGDMEDIENFLRISKEVELPYGYTGRSYEGRYHDSKVWSEMLSH